MFKRNFCQILNIVFVVSCVIHVNAIPEITLYNKNNMDVKMPLSFIFCLRNKNPKTENEKYKKAGYEYMKRFFLGTSMYNESTIGWFGHMENGSTYDSLEGRNI